MKNKNKNKTSKVINTNTTTTTTTTTTATASSSLIEQQQQPQQINENQLILPSEFINLIEFSIDYKKKPEFYNKLNIEKSGSFIDPRSLGNHLKQIYETFKELEFNFKEIYLYINDDNSSSSNNNTNNEDNEIKPNKKDFDTFLIDCLFLLCFEGCTEFGSIIYNQNPTFDDFCNHFKDSGQYFKDYIEIEYIEKLFKKNNSIEFDFFNMNSLFLSIKVNDKSIIRFLKIFGKFLTNEMIEEIGSKIVCILTFFRNNDGKVESYNNEFINEFIKSLLDCNQEFKYQVYQSSLSFNLLSKRIISKKFTFIYSILFDNEIEFNLIFNNDNQQSQDYNQQQSSHILKLLNNLEFWYLISICNCKNILKELLSKFNQIFKPTLNQLNSILYIISKYFSIDFLKSFDWFEKFKNLTTTTTTTTTTDLSSKTAIISKVNDEGLFGVSYSKLISSNQLYQFRIIGFNYFSLDLLENEDDDEIIENCVSFISNITKQGLFISNDLSVIKSICSGSGMKTNSLFLKELELIYFKKIEKDGSCGGSGTNNLISKIIEFNKSKILLALLQNYTQNGCKLNKEFIDEESLIKVIHSKEYYDSLVTLIGYWEIPRYYISFINGVEFKIPYIFFTTSHLTLGFLLTIDKESIMETIDINSWIQVSIENLKLFKDKNELFNKFPKVLKASLEKEYIRTLNIFEFQILFGNNESIELILRDYMKVRPKDIPNMTLDETLILFDCVVLKKKKVRSKSSIQAELDLIEQEKEEKKKLKELKKKKEKLRELNKKRDTNTNTNTGTTSNIQSPTKLNTTQSPKKLAPPSTKVIIKEQFEKLEISSPPSPPSTTTTITTTTTTESTKLEVIPSPTSSTTTTTTESTKLEIMVPDFQIGKFKFNRDESNIIGRGSNGTLVFKGLWNDRIPVAIKQMQKAFNPHIGKEIEVLIKLTSNNCLNMIRYIDQEEDQMFVYLGLTLCEGSLQELIDENKFKQFIESTGTAAATTTGTGTIERILELFKDIINGISFLHSQDIVHNDINPRNILIYKDRFIISDLGLSKMQVETSYSFTMNTPSGQDGYHPAEVLLEKRKTKSVDIFSLGCILYYLLTNGQHPFGSNKLLRVANILYDKPDLESLNKLLSPTAIDLVLSMISKDESKRPTIDSITQHPLFWNIDKRIKFYEVALNLLRDPVNNQPKHNKLLNNLDSSNSGTGTGTVSFLPKPWNQIIDPILIQHIVNKQNQITLEGGGSGSGNSKKVMIYQFDQVRDLVRCIRNTIQHYIQIERLISASASASPSPSPSTASILESLKSRESVLLYFESKFPDLLFHLYKQFKKSDFKSIDYLNNL